IALATYDTNHSNGDDSHDLGSGERRMVHTNRECTYSEFLKCQPLNFKGTKGANSHVRPVGHDDAYGMPWKTLMKMMTENYYPRSEIKKLKTELWNLVVNGADVESYTQCSIIDFAVFKNEAIELARSLMDQKVHTYAARQADNKRRMDNNARDNHVQQPPYKRQNVARAYISRPSEKKEYAGTLPLDCTSPTAVSNQSTLTCFEYGNQGHYLSECPRLKNRNYGNQIGNGQAHGRAYALGG
nr:hypothetical protein [Tanacetum cinerariifolium]